MIGITFLHDLVTMAVGGAPLKLVAPCEGTGYEVGSMSIIKGGKNPTEAHVVRLGAHPGSAGDRRGVQGLPDSVNKNAKALPQAPRLDQTKVIDYDFAKYGSSAERKRLLSKWDREVKPLPKQLWIAATAAACPAAVVRDRWRALAPALWHAFQGRPGSRSFSSRSPPRSPCAHGACSARVPPRRCSLLAAQGFCSRFCRLFFAIPTSRPRAGR